MFALLGRILPSVCLICHAWPARTLCDACVARFAPPVPRCARCALPVPTAAGLCAACQRTPPPLAHCVAAVEYEWPWPQVIQRFKFSQEIGLAAPLARLMMQAPDAKTLVHAVDFAVAIPSSPARMADRGFNPPHLLARHLESPCCADILLRTTERAPQRILGRSARQSNIRGAFAVPATRGVAVRGRHVLLVDDVMTTGATLYEAARVLRCAGAAEVSALVLARD